jgi:hypothetical protein
LKIVEKRADFCYHWIYRIFLKKQKTKKRFFSLFSDISGGEKSFFSLPEICKKNEKNLFFFYFFFVQKTTVNLVIKKVCSFFDTFQKKLGDKKVRSFFRHFLKCDHFGGNKNNSHLQFFFISSLTIRY